MASITLKVSKPDAERISTVLHRSDGKPGADAAAVARLAQYVDTVIRAEGGR